jgi:exodeoxyribonuclease VII small subunit
MAVTGKKKEEKSGQESPVLTFEEKMKRLDEIVRTMELGDRPLEESLALFEEGMKISLECQTLLEEAERKVTMLLSGSSKGSVGSSSSENEEDGSLQEIPFRKT